MTLEDIALVMTPGIGVKGAAHLIHFYGDAPSIFETTEQDLIENAELRPDLARQIIRKTGFKSAEKELTYCRRHDIIPIASTDEEYPPLLRETNDFPHVLYVKGNLMPLKQHCLSMVGTRHATPYGQLMCNRLVEDLAHAIPDLVVVSGLAFGIDVASHRAALASGVATVAVLPNPLPNVMPTQHSAVARDILEHGGTLITEEHSQTKQRGTSYLARNRIIAGLSEGCIVVESPEKGGSLSTARCADGYNRAVMAVPGRANDSSSVGTNRLIRDRKAALVLSAEDIIRELMWDVNGQASIEEQISIEEQLSGSERELYNYIPESDAISTEELLYRSEFDPGTMATLLVGLELTGAIKQLPGNKYIRLK